MLRIIFSSLVVVLFSGFSRAQAAQITPGGIQYQCTYACNQYVPCDPNEDQLCYLECDGSPCKEIASDCAHYGGTFNGYEVCPAPAGYVTSENLLLYGNFPYDTQCSMNYVDFNGSSGSLFLGGGGGAILLVDHSNAPGGAVKASVTCSSSSGTSTIQLFDNTGIYSGFQNGAGTSNSTNYNTYQYGTGNEPNSSYDTYQYGTESEHNPIYDSFQYGWWPY